MIAAFFALCRACDINQRIKELDKIIDQKREMYEKAIQSDPIKKHRNHYLKNPPQKNSILTKSYKLEPKSISKDLYQYKVDTSEFFITESIHFLNNCIPRKYTMELFLPTESVKIQRVTKNEIVKFSTPLMVNKIILKLDDDCGCSPIINLTTLYVFE